MPAQVERLNVLEKVSQDSMLAIKLFLSILENKLRVLVNSKIKKEEAEKKEIEVAAEQSDPADKNAQDNTAAQSENDSGSLPPEFVFEKEREKVRARARETAT